MRALFLTLVSVLAACDLEPEPEPEPEPSGHDHSQHDHEDAGPVAGHGAHVEALSDPPRGDPGTGEYRVRNTGEKPSAASDGVGAFRYTCKYSHANNDDAIVYPGQPGKAHLHEYAGNTKADAYSTADSLRNTGNSTCRGGSANKSGYWWPAVIADGKILAPVESHWYLKRGYKIGTSVKLSPPPSGLRLIAGDMTATAPQSKSVVSFKCWEHYVPEFSGIKDKKCQDDDFVSMEVFFPQCSDGRTDSDTHKAHVVYPVNGKCPSTHPTAIPEMSYHILFRASEINKAKDVKLSSDKGVGGYSAHADWFERWGDGLLKTVVDNCLNPNKDCKSHMLGDGRVIY